MLLHGGPGATHEYFEALERKGEYESPRYMELLVPNFYAKHICRLEEWPDAVNRAFANRKADLGKIAVPTLVIGATHDTFMPTGGVHAFRIRCDAIR